jgi:hypothetical protein
LITKRCSSLISEHNRMTSLLSLSTLLLNT